MIRAVIADDSALLRSMLCDVLKASKRVDVVGQAKNGKEAIALVKEKKPDVLVLDCEMPVMNGLEALRVIMKECPLPVFMFSSLTREGAAVTVKALEYGAIDFLLKPMGGKHKIEEIAAELIRKISLVVIKGRFKLLSQRKLTVSAEKEMPGTKVSVGKVRDIPSRKIDIIAVGSSTGGVQAAAKIVAKLPGDMPPIVWVQHMPPNFTKSFAERLNGMSALEVKEAEDGDRLKKGTCYIANGAVQMELKKIGADYFVKFGTTEKVNGHCPSCDVLYNSVADYFSRTCLGIILTGMGSDGAKGLLRLRDSGAYVLGQNEESCVVYGMPKSAYELGAVDMELDIYDMASGICKVVGSSID